MRFLFSRKSIKYFILVSVIGMVGNLFAGSLPQIPQARQVINLDKVIAAYDAYVDYPSSDNAKVLLATLPTERPDEISGDPGRALDHIFSPDNYPILEQEACSGDRISIEIFFRLLNFTDGLWTELVLSELGWIVRIRPREYLEVLAIYKDSGYVRKHGYPLSFAGPGYIMHRKAYKYRLEKSIGALESVKDPKYAEIKQACIERLRKSIERLPK